MGAESTITYYSIDVEASGPVPGLFNLLSIGATAIVPDRVGRLEIGETFYAELRPVFRGHLDRANEVHGLDLERLEHEGLEPKEAMKRLTSFVERTRAARSTPVFVGHVAVFDWMYIAWYYEWCGLKNPFGYKGIDTKALAMGAMKLPWLDTARETLAERLGIPPQPTETLHRADADALHQAELFIKLLSLAERAD